VGGPSATQTPLVPAGTTRTAPDVSERSWWLVLGAILVLAAILRFVALPGRGTWDSDQGHDMLTLMAFVHDRVFPLVGPPTSIGDFHHGAAYYYLLAPAAWLGNGDPAIVVGEIAVLGVLAVALVASLARAVGGFVAGATAGFLMAVSATAVDESTFLWNPNLVQFTSALAVTAAWRAWTTRRARWWLLAAAAQAATMQCHVLGFVLLPPLIVWLIADARRRSGTQRQAVVRVALGGIAIVALSYVPLLASELQTNFHETREALAFIVGGGQAVAPGPLLRMTFVTLRVLAWPVRACSSTACRWVSRPRSWSRPSRCGAPASPAARNATSPAGWPPRWPGAASCWESPSPASRM
jgi:4-amino-4-deoxy-L-arabinose transferase-like glycosyltransferase